MCGCVHVHLLICCMCDREIAMWFVFVFTSVISSFVLFWCVRTALLFWLVKTAQKLGVRILEKIVDEDSA